jgi:hypothetical protein
MMILLPARLVARSACLCAAALATLALPGTRVQAQQEDRKACVLEDFATQLVDPADDWAVRLRLLQLQGAAQPTALTIRRPSLERAACADPEAPDLTILPVRARMIYNTAYPLDTNNGAMWAGRGVNAALSGGGEVRIGPLSAALYPTAAIQQNRDFAFRRGQSGDHWPYTYDGHRIDWPQRFGAITMQFVDLGQSYVRFDASGATIGISKENLWLGPAQRMPLIMSNTGAGFPHVFVGSARPVNVGIGALELQAFWGRVSESDFFDHDPTNDHTLIAGISGVFEPAFVRGLFIGFNRVYLSAWAGGDLGSYLLEPYVDVRDNPEGDNQLFSIYARWVLPAAGFEAYAEWAREDHWGDWIDLLREPDHSQAYMLGFQKTGSWGERRLRWFGELAHLTASTTLRSGRGVVSFYTHTELPQGYTHRGQLLGAWIGPGSDAQILGVEVGTPRRMSGLSIERVRFDADAYYNQWARFHGQNGHDVSIGAQLRHVEWRGDYSLHAGLGIARRHNRNFVHYETWKPAEFTAETNVQFDLDLRWTPRLTRRN